MMFIKILTIAGAIIAVFFGIMYKVERFISCKEDHIYDLCNKYQDGKITGNLCHELCAAKSIAIHTCLASQKEKRVHQATWKSQEIILKFLLNSEYDSFITVDNLEGQKIPYKKFIGMKVLEMFGRTDDKCQKCSDIIDLLVRMADSDGNGQLSRVEAHSIIQLLDKPESTMLLLLNGTIHGLHFYGYCGPVYATERISKIAEEIYGIQLSLNDFTLPFIAEPLEEWIKESINKIYEVKFIASVIESITRKLTYLSFQYLHQKEVPTLQERFQFAFSFLDAIVELNSNPFGLLQSCDTHLGNFGISNSSIVKFIDMDLMFPKVVVQRMLGGKKCKSDKDCAVGDFRECETSCDLNSGSCTSEFISQDLHNICHEVLATFKFSHVNFDSDSEYVCFIKAVNSVRKCCFNLPSYETVEELQALVVKVKVKLEDVRNGKYKCSQTWQ